MNASMLENINEDLHQPYRIRYASYPSVLDAFISLAYWNELISGVIQSVLVYPSHSKFLSVTELVTPLGRFLVFLWGLSEQCG